MYLESFSSYFSRPWWNFVIVVEASLNPVPYPTHQPRELWPQAPISALVVFVYVKAAPNIRWWTASVPIKNVLNIPNWLVTKPLRADISVAEFSTKPRAYPVCTDARGPRGCGRTPTTCAWFASPRPFGPFLPFSSSAATFSITNVVRKFWKNDGRDPELRSASETAPFARPK